MSSATLVHPCTSRETSASMHVTRLLHIQCGTLGRKQTFLTCAYSVARGASAGQILPPDDAPTDAAQNKGDENRC